MKKMLSLALVILTAAALTAAPLAVPSQARSSPDAAFQQGGELELLDQFPLTNPLGMITSGNLAFIGQHKGKDAELVILDFANPAQPVIQAEIPFSSAYDFLGMQAYPLAVTENILYVGVSNSIGTEPGGIILYDIRDPSNPIQVGVFGASWGGTYIKMAVSGNSAFFLDSNSGVDIWDFSDPVNPSLLGSIPDYPLSSFALQGSILYAHNWNSHKITIYEVSDPAEPVLLSTYSPQKDPLCFHLWIVIYSRRSKYHGKSLLKA